jgi:chromosome segregation ATPase
MKLKVAIIILILLALGLGIGLVKLNQNLEQEQALAASRAASINQLSNEVVAVRSSLQEQQNVNLTLETNLAQRIQALHLMTNSVVNLQDILAKTQSDAKAAADAAAADLAKRDAQIAKLTTEREDMTKEMTDLKGAITKLDSQIADTEKKLATSEGEKAFLVKELKRLQAEKAELEKQFNDLAVLREQVSKLKEQLAISRRLEWIRQGLYNSSPKKGGELLNEGFKPKVVSTNDSSLKVDIRQDGGVKVQPKTNAPSVIPLP